MKTKKSLDLSNNPTALSPLELEKHYTVAQVAAAWALSPSTIRRYFEGLPGVIRIGRAKTKTTQSI